MLRRPAANFGVAILSRARGVNVEPRVVRAGSEDRLVGNTGLPVNCNPYLPEFLDTTLAAGAIRPRAGAYDVVFDSRTIRGAGRFTFRLWISDRTPPAVGLAAATVARGRSVALRVTDRGAGVDPGAIAVQVDGATASWRLQGGRLTVNTADLSPGRHRVTGRVSDYQESRNNENEPRILPNTRRFSLAFTVR